MTANDVTGRGIAPACCWSRCILSAPLITKLGLAYIPLKRLATLDWFYWVTVSTHVEVIQSRFSNYSFHSLNLFFTTKYYILIPVSD